MARYMWLGDIPFHCMVTRRVEKDRSNNLYEQVQISQIMRLWNLSRKHVSHFV